jgi:NAD(P)H-dependent flavin oxidoreductase YrpB (nitropropane dioxygenase family)
MVVDAVGPLPMLGAGGGRASSRRRTGPWGQGILLGTRFFASIESPFHPKRKHAIVDSDGHDHQLTEIPNIAAGLVWPGAMTRSRRNNLLSGSPAALRAAREAGNVAEGPLSM